MDRRYGIFMSSNDSHCSFFLKKSRGPRQASLLGWKNRGKAPSFHVECSLLNCLSPPRSESIAICSTQDD